MPTKDGGTLRTIGNCPSARLKIHYANITRKRSNNSAAQWRGERRIICQKREPRLMRKGRGLGNSYVSTVRSAKITE
jgi:hypothetical protein